MRFGSASFETGATERAYVVLTPTAYIFRVNVGNDSYSNTVDVQWITAHFNWPERHRRHVLPPSAGYNTS